MQRGIRIAEHGQGIVEYMVEEVVLEVNTS